MRALLGLLVLTGCSATFTPPGDEVLLPIPDRQWDDEAPVEGWCGETSIQMAALHFGAWVPQAEANRLGKPTTPDLWEYDVPTSLDALGLAYDTGPRDSPAKLLTWTVASLRQGRPVILGVKFVPTPEPDWDVDHLVLAVGFSPRGLIINTNLSAQQVTVAWAGLQKAEGTERLTLINPRGKTWGFAVRGFEASTPRAEVVSQSDEKVVLRLTASGLSVGRTYVLRESEKEVQRFVADSPKRELISETSSKQIARFTIRPLNQ